MTEPTGSVTVEPVGSLSPAELKRRAKRAAAARIRRAAKTAAAAGDTALTVVEAMIGPTHRPDPKLIERNKTGRISGQKLTPRQGELAKLLAAGVPQGIAGKLTGYTAGSGDASRASNSPAVRARVIALQRSRLQRVAVLGTALITDIITGKVDAPASVRLDAAKYVHKVAGLDTESDKAKEEKDLRTMTLEELERLAARFEARTAPVRPGDDAQVIDATAEVTT